MPYQVSWQSVSMKSQRPVHVLGAALAADTPQQASPPALTLDHRDLEDVSYKTNSNLGRKISIQWRARHSFLHEPDYDSIRPGFLAPLTVRQPLTVTIVLASDAVAEWFRLRPHNATQAIRRFADRAPQAR